VDKAPIAAYQDRQFTQEAKERVSTTFIAHIRYATTGGLRPENTHPFQQRGRLFAHNGVIADLPRLDAELGKYHSLVQGDTDSERFFALITRHIDANGGDIGAGITSAAQQAAAQLPIYSINIVLTTPTKNPTVARQTGVAALDRRSQYAVERLERGGPPSAQNR
jgi:predicted glutamine amidotransferase